MLGERNCLNLVQTEAKEIINKTFPPLCRLLGQGVGGQEIASFI